MGETATIGCAPMALEEEVKRHSNDFSVNQLPHTAKLRWHIITKHDADNTGIRFNVKEHHTYKDDDLRFENIGHGSVTPYHAYRNLYISDVENAPGYFIVKVEAYEEELA